MEDTRNFATEIATEELSRLRAENDAISTILDEFFDAHDYQRDGAVKTLLDIRNIVGRP